MLLIIVFCIFIAVSLLVCVILYPLLSKRSVVQERLEKLAAKENGKPRVSIATEKTPWQDFLARVGAVLPMAPKEQSRYTRMLVAAGFRRESIFIFLGSKILLALGLPTASSTKTNSLQLPSRLTSMTSAELNIQPLR